MEIKLEEYLFLDSSLMPFFNNNVEEEISLIKDLLPNDNNSNFADDALIPNKPYTESVPLQGWQCPKCKRIYSPSVRMCPCCQGNNQNVPWLPVIY